MARSFEMLTLDLANEVASQEWVDHWSAPWVGRALGRAWCGCRCLPSRLRLEVSAVVPVASRDVRRATGRVLNVLGSGAEAPVIGSQQAPVATAAPESMANWLVFIDIIGCSFPWSDSG